MFFSKCDRCISWNNPTIYFKVKMTMLANNDKNIFWSIPNVNITYIFWLSLLHKMVKHALTIH